MGTRRSASIFLAPPVAICGLFLYFPLVQVAWLALHRWDGYGPQTFVGLGNFGTLGGDGVFRTALQHSLAWSVAAALPLTLLSLGLALAIARSRARSLLLAVLFLPVLLPATVVAAVWVLVLTPLSGLLNSVLRASGLGSLAADWLGDPHLALAALFVAWSWSVLGVGTLLFWAGLRAIGRDYLDLALAEGAGAWQRARYVLLPGVGRTGVVVLLMNVALAGQVFDLVYVTTGGGPGYATLLLPLDMYARAFGGHTGQGAAVACVQLVVGLVPAVLAAATLGWRTESMDSGESGRTSVLGTWRPTLLSVVAVALVMVPLAWLTLAAIEPGRAFALYGAGPALDPRNWDGNAFGNVWAGGMGTAVVSSLLLAGAAVLGTLLAAVPAAFALAHLVRRRGVRPVWGGVLLVGLFQPSTVLVIPLYALLRQLQLLDSPWGVLLPEIGRTVPFAVLVLWGALAGSPRGVLEAALIDGASPLQQLLRVALPLVRPATVVVMVWTFVSSWNEYLLPTLVLSDPSQQTVPMLLATSLGRYNTQYNLLAAGALLAALPPAILYVVLRLPAMRGLRRMEGEVR